VPRFPSGLLYPRALPFSYCVAAITGLLGESEFSVRFLSAFLSTAAVALVYALGRRVFGFEVALLAALVMTLSYWEILVGGNARMYAALSFAFLLSLYLMYRVSFENAGPYRSASVLASVLACLLHQIGGMLVLPFGTLLMFRKKEIYRRSFVVLSIALVVVTTLSVMKFVNHHYDKWDEHVAAEFKEKEDGFDREVGPSFFETVRDRCFPLFDAAADRIGNGHLTPVLGMSLLISVAVAGLLRRIVGRGAFFMFAAFLTSVAVCLQQIAAAGYITAGFAVTAYFQDHQAYRMKSALLLSLMFAGAALWMTFGVFGTDGLSLARIRRAMIAYPPNFLEFYVRRYPWMFVMVAVGCVEILGAYRYRRKGAGGIYLLAALILPAVGLGLHPLAIQKFAIRYAYILNPYFILIYAYGIWSVSAKFERLLRQRNTRTSVRRIARVAIVLALLLITKGIDPTKTVAAVTRHYGINKGIRYKRGPALFCPDNQGASRYVCRNASENDLVVVMDILIHYTYCSRADFELTLSSKCKAEGWFGSSSLRSMDEMVSLVNTTRSERVWFVLSGRRIRDRQEDPEMRRLLAFFESPDVRRVYRGRDGLSDVYLLKKRCLPGVEPADGDPR